MDRLNQLIANFKDLEAHMNDYIIEVLRNNDNVIVEMNSEEQLYEQGITRDGKSIASYAPYSPITIEIKKEKGQPTNRVTLRDEEDFHESFYVIFNNDSFEVYAADWKVETLKVYYGDEILGLTDENLIELARQYVLPELIKKIKAL